MPRHLDNLVGLVWILVFSVLINLSQCYTELKFGLVRLGNFKILSGLWLRFLFPNEPKLKLQNGFMKFWL